MNNIFVGRQNEIEIVKKAIFDGNKLKIVLVHGQAGVGKTTFLQHVDNSFADSLPNLMVGDLIIDFDDSRYKFLDSLLAEIARQVGSKYFQNYFQVINARRDAEQKGVSPARLARLSIDVEEMFVEDLKQACNQKRIILRFDTAEKIIDPILEYPENDFWDVYHPFIKLIKMTIAIPNIVMLVAGRTVNSLQAPLLNYIESGDVLNIPLSPFSREVSNEILRELERYHHIIIDDYWCEALHYLSGGLPIILNMATDWIRRDISLAANWLNTEKLHSNLFEYLKSEYLELANSVYCPDLTWNWYEKNAPSVLLIIQKEFRKVLISHLIGLKTEEDLLIVTLAKVNPLDVDGISAMLDMDLDRATELLSIAKERSDVKLLPDGRIRLTDAMEELVLDNIWPIIDEEGVRENRSNKKAISYLEHRSKMLLTEIEMLRDEENLAVVNSKILERNQAYNQKISKEQEFWIVRTEYLRRLFALDVKAGLDDFLLEFERANQFGYILAQESILEVIKSYINKGLIDGEKFYLLEKKIAEYYVKSGKYKEASLIYEELLQKHSINDAERADLLIGQGSCLMRSAGGPGLGSSIRRAIQKYQEADKIFSEIKIDRKSEIKLNVLLSLGWSYRTLGHLHESEDYYNQCYRLALLTGRSNYLALAANGMSYVFSLFRDVAKAEKYSEEAISTWQKLIQEQPERTQEYRNRLSQSYNTSGEINIELGRPQQAKRFFESAVEIFSELGLEEWMSRAFCGRGFSKWMIGAEQISSPSSSSLIWEDALKDLDRSYQLATNLDLSLVQRRRSKIEWSLGQYEATIVDLLTGMRLAQQVGDMYNEYGCLCDLLIASNSHEIAGYTEWKSFNVARLEYLARNPDINFPHLDGIFFTSLANKSLLAGDTQEAISLYKRGLGILSRHGTYLDQNISGQLEKTEKEIFSQISQQSTIKQVGDDLLSFWQRPGGSEGVIAPEALRYFVKWSRL